MFPAGGDPARCFPGCEGQWDCKGVCVLSVPHKAASLKLGASEHFLKELSHFLSLASAQNTPGARE